MRKLRSKSGETLAEVLVAILVVAVSASLFWAWWRWPPALTGRP